jgi:cytochrome d ubiquinol oxidase subunit II
MEIPLPALQNLAYFLVFASIVAYAALDGFDLGVGVLHLYARNDHDRRIFLNAIGPLWDGNSVWIVIAFGVLFAGFPHVFASLMSGLYLPMMILVFGFMFRAAAMEFRSKRPEPSHRQFWDFCFFASSFFLSLDFGMIVANLMIGLPIETNGELVRAQLDFFNPYSFMIGLLNVALFSLHGSIFLAMKTTGELRIRVRELVPFCVSAFLVLWGISTVMTALLMPKMFVPFFEYPILLIFVVIALATIFSIPYFEKRGQYQAAFLASTGSIAMLVTLVGIGFYPVLLKSSIADEHTLTIYNSSSSRTTLSIVAAVALTGIPLSFFYFKMLYNAFKGHVEIDDKISY